MSALFGKSSLIQEFFVALTRVGVRWNLQDYWAQSRSCAGFKLKGSNILYYIAADHDDKRMLSLVMEEDSLEIPMPEFYNEDLEFDLAVEEVVSKSFTFPDFPATLVQLQEQLKSLTPFPLRQVDTWRPVDLGFSSLTATLASLVSLDWGKELEGHVFGLEVILPMGSDERPNSYAVADLENYFDTSTVKVFPKAVHLQENFYLEDFSLAQALLYEKWYEEEPIEDSFWFRKLTLLPYKL